MDILAQAKKVLLIEAQAVTELAHRLVGEQASQFTKAVDIVSSCQGKIVTTGIGKSGIIARKLAATFSSTGSPAIYLHPSEGAHGDLGVIGQGDVLIAFSYRGEAEELMVPLNFAARRGIPVIALTSSAESRLGKAATVVLDVSVSSEACPLNLAPTASTTASLAMGDALAMCVLVKKGFSPEDFAEVHPGGALGRKLLRVRDIMHAGKSLPLVSLSTPMKEVTSVMTGRDVRGVAGVVDGDGRLVGVITDGDLRRRLEKSQDPLSGVAKDIMILNPKTIDADELAEKALFFMEEFKIQLLFVVEKDSADSNKPVGIVNFQDLFKARVR